MRRYSSVALALVCLFLTALAVLAPGAAAQKSLECEKVWTGPSADNDLLDCIGNVDRIKDQWRYLMWTLFCVILFLVVLIGIPILWCCRCCRCCHDCVQPHVEYKRQRARCWLWMWIVIAILWAMAVCVFVVYGAQVLTASANKVLDDVDSGPLTYVERIRDDTVAMLTDYSVDPPKAPSIDLSAFDDLVTQVRDKKTTVKDDYFKYFKIVKIVSIVVGVVGVVLMLLIIPFACCRCTGCCPVVFTIVYYVFGIIFALLAVVLTVVQYLVTSVCGEVQMQYRRQPGIVQWLLVPWCNNEFDFEGVRGDVATEVRTNSEAACDEMLKYCDASPVINPSGENVFYCGSVDGAGGTPMTSSAECTTIQKCTNAILSSYVKESIQEMVCPAPTGAEFLDECTVRECAERCIDYTDPPVTPKTWSADIVAATNFALNASNALSYVMPLLSCNFIADKLLSAIETEAMESPFFVQDTSKKATCSEIHVSAITLACGFFIGALTFFIGTYVIVRGSFVWESAEDRGDRTPARSTDDSCDK